VTDQLTDDVAPVEPSAVNRAVARNLRGMYQSLVDEGFDNEQALELIQGVITATVIADYSTELTT
jgi:hypothetical protein